jgi:hypothetical protein
MSETKVTETLDQIANRVPPGDRWQLIRDSRNTIYSSLMDTLEAYFIETKFRGDFRFCPSEGKIFIIKRIEEEVIPEPPKRYNIYGEPE